MVEQEIPLMPDNISSNPHIRSNGSQNPLLAIVPFLQHDLYRVNARLSFTVSSQI